jgi:hypothetical protein
MRRRLVLTLLALCAAAAIVMGTLGSTLWNQTVFHGADLLAAHYPWKSETTDILRIARYGPVSDTFDGTLPGRHEFATRARHGQLALWNPYTSGGTPLASTPSAGVWSPINIPFLIFPINWAPAIAKLVEMATAMGFTFLFLRRLKLDPAASILGGFTFASSGFLVMWTNWPQPQVAATIPVLFWAVERYLQLRTLRAALPVAIAVGLLLIGGFPVVALYGFFLLGPYVVVRLLASRSINWPSIGARTVVLGAAAVVGVLLSAFLLLPFAKQLGGVDLGYRRQEPNAHLALRVLTTTFAPDALGSSVHKVWYGGLNQIETIAYVGAAAMVLAVAGAAFRPRPAVPRGARAYFAVAMVIVVLLIFVPGPQLGWFQHLPEMRINFIGRMRSILGFGCAVLAAMGFDAALTGRPTKSSLRDRALSVAVFVVAALMALATTREARNWAIAVGQRHYFTTQVTIPVEIAAFTLVAVIVARMIRKPTWIPSAALGCVLVVAAAQSVAFVHPLLPRIPKQYFYPVTATHRYLSDNLHDQRYASSGLTLWPGTNTYYRQRSVTGHGFTEPAWADLLRAVDPDVRKTATFYALHPTLEIMTSPILDRLGAKYFVLDPTVPPPGTAVPPGAATGTTRLAPGDTATTTAPAQPVRAVTVQLAEKFLTPDPTAALSIELRDPAGHVVAKTKRTLDSPLGVGTFTVPVAGEAMPSGGQMAIRIGYVGRTGSVVLGTGENGEPVVGFTTPVDDGLRLVADDSAQIYLRENWMPRIRWASRSETITDPATRVERLAAGVDPDTVILSQSGPKASGESAAVDVRKDSPERIHVHVDAQGDGYLVVADAIQSGWVASVDGKPTDLVDADHAGVAVPVPAGEHDITFQYHPAGRTAGFVLTAVGLAVLTLVWFLAARWRSTVWNPIAEPESGDTERGFSSTGPVSSDNPGVRTSSR